MKNGEDFKAVLFQAFLLPVSGSFVSSLIDFLKEAFALLTASRGASACCKQLINTERAGLKLSVSWVITGETAT